MLIKKFYWTIKSRIAFYKKKFYIYYKVYIKFLFYISNTGKKDNENYK